MLKVFPNFLSKIKFLFQKSHRELSRIGLDQIHEWNNKLIKGCGGASGLLNKVEDSSLIRWQTCSPEITCVILEFKDCLDRKEILADSSNRHPEESLHFHERFSSDVNRLIKCITVNSFMQDHLTKLNKKIILTETIRNCNWWFRSYGRKAENFVSDQLVVSKVPISQKFTLNKIKISDHTGTGQLKCKVNFFPSKSALKKINSEKWTQKSFELLNCWRIVWT